MDPDFFITVLHVPDGPHFSKSGTTMVVPVVAGATPLHMSHVLGATYFVILYDARVTTYIAIYARVF